MAKYKVNSPEDIKFFQDTTAYKKIYDKFKDLKISRGRIIHILGAPGTGKSTHIYEAIMKLDLNIYDVPFNLEYAHISSKDVYHRFFNTLKSDLSVRNDEELYLKASEYDAILFADKFHDSHLLHEDKVGFSLWMDCKKFKSLPFFLRLILVYIKHIKEFKKINLIFQTAWRIRLKGAKYDLFTDFGLLSKFFVGLMKILFEVVELSYSDIEIIKIVKERYPSADEYQIKLCRDKYGNRIRFILECIERRKINTRMD
ncbi:MAG: hypothetical protein LLF83_03840 [Methanobacterium sp.]|nr:hypothetical protein [Methanobacterium sp.]